LSDTIVQRSILIEPLIADADKSLLSPPVIRFLRFLREKISQGGVSDGISHSLPLVEYKEIDLMQAIMAPPTDINSAVLIFLLVAPTPSEVYEFLPTIFAEHAAGLTDYVKRDNPLPSYSGSRLSNAEKEYLTELYPRNAGRPGGKIHVELVGLVTSLSHSALSNQIARHLLSIGALNEWELTTAASLILLPHTSRIGAEVVASLFSFDIDRLSVRDLAKFFKAFHTTVRVTRILPGHGFLSVEEANLVYGVDLLTGPSEFLKASAREEILMRLKDQTLAAVPKVDPFAPFSETEYEELFDESLRQIIDETLPEAIKWKTFEEWYAQRFAWAASGGSPGATLTWTSGKERMNKRGTMTVLTYEQVRNVLECTERPINYSKAAIKFEKGKTRMIWNTSIYHYLFQAYVLDCLDNAQTALPSPKARERGLPTGWNASAHDSAARLASQYSRLCALRAPKSIGLMWDFSDFNINHKLLSMLKLFARMGSAMAARLVSSVGQADLGRMRADFDACVDSISKARWNTILDSADQDQDPLIAEIVRSLQSGERATSFTNTFLNRTYIRLVQLYSARYLQTRLISDNLSQQGDDVFAIVENVFAGLLAATLINLTGAAGQLYKITMDYGPRGEFLRYAYDGV